MSANASARGGDKPTRGINTSARASTRDGAIVETREPPRGRLPRLHIVRDELEGDRSGAIGGGYRAHRETLALRHGPADQLQTITVTDPVTDAEYQAVADLYLPQQAVNNQNDHRVVWE